MSGYWNMSFYTGSPYTEMAQMPIVIATSSIALQKAIVKDYIPQLSDIMLEHGVIKTPLTSVIRKGRDHYVCERNLRSFIPFERNPEIKKILKNLLEPSAPIDTAEIDGLNAYTKRKISVPDRCDKNCPYNNGCTYLRFREQAQSAGIDIQVCNHNYLLADILRRADNQRPLIPNYQSVIIDEAHKFLSAARSMYGVELSCATLFDIHELALSISFKHETVQKSIYKTASRISNASARLFRRLEELSLNDNANDETERCIAVIDAENQRHIRNIGKMAGALIEMLKYEPEKGNGSGRKAQLVWELEQIYEQTDVLLYHQGLICWIEPAEHDCRLCAIPKDLDRRLYNDLWRKGIPTVLTSGTLSANGDFTHIKRTLGIDRVDSYRLAEISKPSPFNYRKNALIYISENTSFPDRHDKDYILSVADEIEKLIYASHGHAAVLFTSFKVMDMVWKIIEERELPFPMFRLNKGAVREIDYFKHSGNGVLFAAGALWEGIDIPGNVLSMLIIVKLPFPVPDPISEYERTLYDDLDDFKEAVIKPEMLIKSKQGAGRVIRTEKDTGCIAVLDVRAGKNGAYRDPLLGTLPDCYVTDDINDVEEFFKVIKTPEYFM
jgi:ATP-dependent DNA helicase DinG